MLDAAIEEAGLKLASNGPDWTISNKEKTDFEEDFVLINKCIFSIVKRKSK